jgi:glycosyltransferase involved in cell wall biosynthesis
MKPVAVVTPWFGEKTAGGAERTARQIAHRLQNRGYAVEVLTTCCDSFFSPWGENQYETGETADGDVTVRRFSVDSQNFPDFDRVNRILLSHPPERLLPGCSPVSPELEQVFIRENINSRSLLQYLKENQSRYHAFLFIPYLYGPILQGLPLVADKALLQPCLHDEAYAYLSAAGDIFRQARAVLFHTEGESKLARALYGPGIDQKGFLVGTGVERPEERTGKPNPALRAGRTPYLLCIGKRDPKKNTGFLTDVFAAYKKKHPDSPLQLILCGPGTGSYSNPEAGIEDRGEVGEKEKQALLEHCLALVNPSLNESYSRVIMEAWLAGKPVAANSGCLATAGLVKEAQGGLTAAAASEWIDVFHRLSRMRKRDLRRMGRKGYAYACRHADWDAVIDRYEKILLDMQETAAVRTRPGTGKTIHQIMPVYASGDAISRQAVLIRKYLLQKGYKSDIFTCHIEPGENKANQFHPDCMWDADAVIYHHSIGTELLDFIQKHQGPKALMYHNITPAHYFEYDPPFAALLQEGRRALKTLAGHLNTGYGDSAYNTRELKEAGFKHTGVLPIVIDPAVWKTPPDPQVMDELQGKGTHIIFVGRIAPNKCPHHLIEAFVHYLGLDPGAKLHLVGKALPDDAYYHHLLALILKYKLHRKVFIAGKVDQSRLHAYYRCADLFWSMSEHEGFGVPLIESMWFDIPVLAYRAAAVPETLDRAGVMFEDKSDWTKLARRAYRMIHEPEYRDRIIAGQRRRREAFLPGNVLPRLEPLLQRLEEEKPAKRKVAFVVQRCGQEVSGGAEDLCLQLAGIMKDSWDIDILTTCAKDYTTWENHYSRGKNQVGEVPVVRFPVDQVRDTEAFNQISAQLNRNLEEADAAQQEAWMIAQGPVSKSLVRYIKKRRRKYDAFVFFTYLYASTYFTLPEVAKKSILVPTAHDEWMIKMGIWDWFFDLPRGFLFLSEGEKEFLSHRFPHAGLSGPVIQIPVSSPTRYSPERFREKYDIQSPYLLYVGRLDASKGCLELIHFFINFCSRNATPAKLVLIGKGAMNVPKHPAVISLGYVDTQTKWDALAGCEWLVNPSAYESLSLVLLEAWNVKRPVLVTAKCGVMVRQCMLSQGGLWYNGYQEFEKILLHVDDSEKDRMGEQGCGYVQAHHSRNGTRRKMEESIGRVVWENGQ